LITSPLTRFAVLAVGGAAALSIAGCHTTTTQNPATSPPAVTAPTTPEASPPAAPAPATTTPAPANEAKVWGKISSVTGNTVQVTEQEKGKDVGHKTVNFTPTTKVTEDTKGALSDVTQGSCVTVRPTVEEPQAGAPITAKSVHVKPAVDGKCEAMRNADKPEKKSLVQGTVASVEGNTINLTSTDASGSTSQKAVTVDDKTSYLKQSDATSAAITAGKCLAARGTQDANGALEATHIKVKAANPDGSCGGHPKGEEHQEHQEH